MKTQSLIVNFAEMSDDELIKFRNWLLTEKATIDDEWVDELQLVTKENIDPYSRKGERVLKKLGTKYAEKAEGLVYLQDLVADELAKRKKYREQQRYLGKSEVKEESLEEFLEKEAIITDSYKSKIGD